MHLMAMNNQFKPAWWLSNSHLQTLWPQFCRADIKNLTLERERFELADGDFIDLDWLGKNRQGPLVLVLHGFEGSIDSHYAKGMLRTLEQQGWRGVFMHFRGCSGEPNRLPRGYHSGDTADLACIVKELHRREQRLELAAIGYSLGGNVLLKWLGETSDGYSLKAAIAISVPFELNKVARRIQQGFSKVYQWYFLKCLRERLFEKFEQVSPVIDPAVIKKAHTLQDFDDSYTAPLHGFSNAEEYYAVSSSRQYLHAIQVPTLVVHAKDDPFMTIDTIPSQNELSPYILLEVSERGGHLGFIGGKYPWRPEYWLEERIPQFLQQYL
jgi:uncharacterized protein